MKNNTLLDKIIWIFSKFQLLITALGSFLSFGAGVYKGLHSKTVTELVVWSLVGLIGAAILWLIFIGGNLWDLASDKLEEYLGHHPNMRRNILIFSTISILFVTFGLVWYMEMDIVLKIIMTIFYALIFPSASVSLLREERLREQFSLLSNRITPELIAQSPQAAVEHAFTLFEDHLRKRVEARPNIFGETLINEAYGQAGKLHFSDVEGENRGVRNLISGVYATFRNPRKHRLVEDDKYTALTIIALVDLLMHLVDQSTETDGTSANNN